MINEQNDLAGTRVSTPKIPFFIVLAFCIPVALTARTLAYIDPANHDLVGLDFRAFYTAGKMLLANARLYDLSQQWAWQKALWPELSHSSELLYIPYPPFDILPMALVAMLPLHVAYAVWLAAQSLILSALCFLMVNSSDDVSPRTRLITLAFCLSALPVLLTLVHGQLSFLLAISTVLAWRDFKSGHERRGGFWLSLLAIKPQFVFVPLLLLLFLRRRRALEGMLLSIGALTVLSVLLVGTNGLLDYLRLLAAASQWGEAYGIHPQSMHSWRSFLHQLLQTNAATHVQFFWLAGVIATLALLGWSWRNAWQPASADFDLRWALLLIAITFCSPHTNTHDLCLLLFAGVLIINHVAELDADFLFLRRTLMTLVVLGYGLIWLWFMLGLAGLKVMAITVLFQLFAMIVLARSCWKLEQAQKLESATFR